jgi:pimeloyl-ACP methyl ester carboxylesterase
MAVLVEGAGVPIAVTERGAGRPLLLIHDIASDALDLAPVADALADRARVVAYDRRGYGGSGATVPYEATTVNEQAEDAAAVLGALGARDALVLGAGFGALVALDLLSRHPDLATAAVLSDPPLFAFVAEANEALAVQRMALEEALREGGPELAVERWLGPAADAERLARARASHRAFFADVAGIATWPVTRGALRALDRPFAIVTGPRTPQHVRAAADALAELLPTAVRRDDADLAAAAVALLS